MKRALFALLTLLAAGLAAPSPTVAAGNVAPCSWQFRLDTNGINTLYLDQNVTYWVARIPLASAPDGLVIKGDFPHSRYMSFTSYNAATRATDSIYDAQIAPDAGSANPWLSPGDRNLTQRSYTVFVKHADAVPATPAANTLYASSTAEYFIVYRVYLPDRGTGEPGGVLLPAISLLTPAGSTSLSRCSEDQSASGPGGLNDVFAQTGSLVAAPFDCPGTRPPTWHRFYNFGTSVAQGADCGSGGPPASRAEQFTTRSGPGGFLEDRENAYLFTVLNDRYGQLTVIRARPPAFPSTYNGETPFELATQLRYWSYCSYDFVSQRVYACLFDQAVVRDQDGFVTVVVSSPANRPACAPNWLPFGPNAFAVLILRNQLPAAGFRQSIQNATEGRLASDMGPYFPAATYMSRATFESRHGCVAAATATAPGLPTTGGRP